MPVKLTDTQAADAIAPFLKAIGSTTDPVAFGALGTGLGAVERKLTDVRAADAIAPFLGSTTDPVALEAIGTGLGALPVAAVSLSSRESLVPQVMRFLSTPIAVGSFETGLLALLEKLSGVKFCYVWNAVTWIKAPRSWRSAVSTRRPNSEPGDRARE